MTTHKFTDEQFEQLFNPDTSVGTFKKLKEQVSERFSYIMTQIHQIVGRKYHWYDFDNEGGNEYSPGSFDPELYSDEIGITGEYEVIKNADFSQYTDSFPTSWLKEDFEMPLRTEVADFLAQAAKDKAAKKEKAAASLNKNTILAEQIFAKLNDEEKAFLISPSFAHSQEQLRQDFHKKAKAAKLEEKQRNIQYHLERKNASKNKP
jgi:hypothetical protein